MYLMACKRKKMDGRRKSLQADLLGCEWTELQLLVAVPCLARHRLPGTWAALGSNRQNQGAVNPLELGEGSTDSKLLQRRVHWKGQPKEKKKKIEMGVVGERYSTRTCNLYSESRSPIVFLALYCSRAPLKGKMSVKMHEIRRREEKRPEL